SPSAPARPRGWAWPPWRASRASPTRRPTSSPPPARWTRRSRPRSTTSRSATPAPRARRLASRPLVTMSSMSELFEQLDELRRVEGRAAAATLVSTHGTTPRKEGARMWVGEGGRILGSVTIGGCVDAQVMAEAEDVLADSRPRLLSLDLGDEDAWEIGLTCGGTIEVFVEPLALGPGAAPEGGLQLYEAVQAHVTGGGAGAIVTRMDPPQAGAKLLWLDDGRRLGSVGDATLDEAAAAAARAAVPTGVSRTVRLGPDEAVRCFVEVHVPPPTLLVVGAGHVAMPLVTLARP